MKVIHLQMKAVVIMPKKRDLNKESIKIISVAAFCFSIVSFITTAAGLGDFVFTDKQAWQATIISFSVQSILFVFNLRLPGYFNKINSNINAKYKMLRIFKIMVVDSVFVFFYFSVLVASSLFSFVYIYDSSYLSRDINYIDADIVLTNEYNSALKNYTDYINEHSKNIELQMSDNVIELINKLPHTSDDMLNLEDLEKKVDEEQENYNLAVSEYNVKESEIESYQKIIDDGFDSDFWMTEIISDAILQKEKADQELATLNKEKSEAKKRLNEAKKALNKYEKPKEEIAKEFLIKLLQNDISGNLEEKELYLNNALSKINEMVEKFITDEDWQDSFGEVVQIVQKLNITKDEYIKLNTALEQDVINTQVVLPNVNEKGNDDIIRWKEEWKRKYESLEDNISVLSSYDATDDLERLDKYKREYLTDISKIEKSWEFLFDKNRKYPFNVRFSAVFAIFLDLASLIVGIFIYYHELGKSNNNGNN